jgi:hypothetical protein
LAASGGGVKSVSCVRISLEVPEALYRFVVAYCEYVGIEVEEFLYSALCYSLEELAGGLQERWLRRD